jgi:clan AA aspartic protease (TIGR02281 family)
MQTRRKGLEPRAIHHPAGVTSERNSGGQSYCPRCAAIADGQKCACGWSPKSSTRTLGIVTASLVVACALLFVASNLRSWSPDKPGAAGHLSKGKDYLDQDNFEQAILEFKQAINLDPSNAQSHFQLAKALDENNQANQGLEEMKLAAKLKPDDFDINSEYIGFLEDFGKYEEALPIENKFLALHPHDAKLKRQASWLYEQLGDNEKALRLMREAVQADPHEEKNWYNLAGLLDDTGKKADGIAALKQGIRAVPDGESLYYELGLFLSASKHPKDAIEPLKKALTLDSEDEDASMLLERVTKAAGKPVYIVKLKKSGMSFIADVVINEKVHTKLVLDSGATSVVISNSVTKKLGAILTSAPTVTFASASGQATAHELTLKSIRVGEATVNNLRALAYDCPSQDGEEGLLGMSFLSHFKFTLDAEHSQLWLYNR